MLIFDHLGAEAAAELTGPLDGADVLAAAPRIQAGSKDPAADQQSKASTAAGVSAPQLAAALESVRNQIQQLEARELGRRKVLSQVCAIEKAQPSRGFC